MKMKARHIAGAAMIAAGVLLVAAAAALFMRNTSQNRDFEKASAEILPSVRQIIKEHTPPETVVNAVDSAQTGEPYESEYAGILEIPAIELELPVFSSPDEENLEKAPCRYYGRADSNDLVIAGHNYSSGFGRLENISRGDDVYFTDMNGNVYIYTVGEIEMLAPGDILPMINSEWQLSLYTCNYSGDKRLTIRCSCGETA